MQHEINTTADFEPRRTRAEVLKGEIEWQINEVLHLDFIELPDSPMTSGVSVLLSLISLYVFVVTTVI